MDENKMKAILAELSGLAYIEWRMIVDHMERQFNRKISCLQLSEEDMQETANRMSAELEPYFASLKQ